jgi:UDP-N-acetylmuramate--alanine ligase
LAHEFATAFNQADQLVITEIYAASEKPIPGVSGEGLTETVRRHGHHRALFEPDVTLLHERVMEWLQPGDVVLTLGAGNITKVGERLLEALRK